MRLAGRTVVEHVARRARAARLVDKVVFAVPDTAVDDVLADHLAEEVTVDVCRGPDADVLTRFAMVVERERPQFVVRLTADDPLKDPALIDRAVEILLADSSLAYVSNSIEASFPEGLDVEAVTAEALLAAAAEATSALDREHVTPFVWRQPHRFGVAQFRANRDLSSWRWTLDTPDDLRFLAAVLEALPPGEQNYAYPRVVDLLESNPDLLEQMPSAPRSVDKLTGEMRKR
jgi:spore coat polysaccharide biosynthesis protein SpsF